ncbi:MAG: translocation/assembly module TamB domain-containing protein [Vibrio sp.]
MKPIFKWIIGIILLIPTTVLVAILLIGLLVFTNVGLSSGLWIAQKALPELKVGSTEGSLLPAFTLNDVEYNNPELGIKSQLKRLDFAVTMDCLFEHSVCVDTVAINGLNVDMPSLPESEPTPDDESSTPVPAVFLPIPISLTHLELSDIKLNVLGYKASWDSFTTGVYALGNTVTIRPTKWNTIRLALPAEDKNAPPKPEPVDNTPLSKRPDIQLPDVSIPLTVKIEQFDVNDFELQQETPIKVNHLGLRGSMDGGKVAVEKLSLDMPEADLDLKTNINLSGNYPLTLTANGLVKMPDYAGQKISLNAKGSVANLTLSSELSGLAKAKLDGSLKPLKAILPFDLKLKDVKGQWPMKGKADYKFNADHITTSGSLDGYDFDLLANAEGKDIPAVKLDAMGNGDLSQVDLKKLRVDTLGGNITGQAMANWSSPIHWKATLGLANIQPGLQWPQAEGNISGTFVHSGSLTEKGGWKVEFPSLSIDGKLRNLPLILRGQLFASDETGKGDYQLETRGLRLAHGQNGLRVKGKLDKQWNLDAIINVPELSKTVPGLKGQIEGDIQVRGEPKTPDVITDLAVNNIDWNGGEATLKSMLLKGTVSPLPAPSGDIKLSAEGGKYQAHQLKRLNLSFKGNEKDHVLDLDTVTDLVTADITVQGGMIQKPEQAWKGQLSAARIMLMESQTKTKTNPVWSINHPVNIQYGMTSQKAFVQAHCWQHDSSKICLDKDLSAGSAGEANVSIQHFTFDNLKAFIPPETSFDAEMNATSWVKWAENTPPQLTLDLNVPSGSVTQKIENPLVVKWDDIKLSANLKQNKLDLNWLIDLTKNGDIKGQATIPNVTAEQMAIDGNNAIESINLDFLHPLIGDQNALNVNIESKLNFNGPIMQPKVVGNLDVDKLNLEGQMFPVDVTKGFIKTQFSGYSATLNSTLETPDGRLQLEGDANWAQMDNWFVNLHTFGKELKVESPPMVALKVTPDLAIAINPQVAKISGTIDIPWGRILVEDLPESAVGVSSDEVLLDNEFKPIKEDSALPMAVETDVKISIGDDVRMDAFGLKAYLVGNLNVSQKNKGPFVLGEVRLEKGTYKSFGQDLIIEEGKILMNGPVDKPYVSIKAIRNPDNTEDDVTVGIRVTGPADKPEAKIFSEPAMSQTSALSYLLRGRDIDDTGGGNAMTSALIGLSLAKSGRMVGELGAAVGVQDLQLGSSGSGDDSQVEVSGYIAPGLQVKYGVGIFNSVGEFSVRYELFTSFYVEAITGLDSAVDFIYQFNFN